MTKYLGIIDYIDDNLSNNYLYKGCHLYYNSILSRTTLVTKNYLSFKDAHIFLVKCIKEKRFSDSKTWWVDTNFRPWKYHLPKKLKRNLWTTL